MSEIKLELIRLLKIPLIGFTVVVAVWILGVEIGSVSEFSIEGVKFHPGTMNQSTEVTGISINNDLDVSLPSDAKNTIAEVTKSQYAESPSTTGWVYLGTYVNGVWSDRLIEISEYLVPEVGRSYVVLVKSISARTGKPTFPLYKLKTRIGFANKGDLIKLVSIDSNLGRNRVWAKVEVYPLIKES